MELYRHLNPKNRKKRVITLGVFDGVHKGHEKLISCLKSKAKKLKLISSVITFEDHPHGTLAPSARPPRLASSKQCIKRLEMLDVDEVFLIAFTKQLAELEAVDFVEKILVNQLAIRHIVVGEDFVFGKQGKGNSRLLKKLGVDYGFGVTVVAPLTDGKQVISSSKLRQLIAKGNIAKAGLWLGWPYALHGVVERGDGRGSQLGIPTANLRTTHEIVPSPGTYAVLALVKKHYWPALCHIGNRPTFHKWGPETIETYIPGWKGRLYGQQIELDFYKRLRNEIHFNNADALIWQIKKDWQVAQQYWPENVKVAINDLGPLISDARKNLGEL